MKSSRRGLHLLLCSIAGPLGAQEPSAAKPSLDRAAQIAAANRKLHDADLATVATGASLVAEARLTECAGEVRARLATLRPIGTAERNTVLTLLDALLCTDARLDAAELLPFAQCRTMALLLAAREPVTHVGTLRACLARCDEWMSDEAAIAGRMLAALRDPAFATELLQRRWEIAITATDPDPTWHTSIGMNSHVGSQHEVPTGFPPIPRYRLGDASKLKEPADPAAAWHIPFERSLERDGFSCSTNGGYREYREHRIGWLARMLGHEHRAAIDAIDAPAQVAWRDAASFDAEIARRRSVATGSWRRVVDLAVAKRLLTADAGKVLQPKIEFTFLDARTERRTPLPKGRNDDPSHTGR